MKLHVFREPSEDGATFGALFVNDRFECLVLEDQIREQSGIQVAAWKVDGQTAIPVGTYKVEITPSQRFHRLLPQLLDVPGFSGIRIHPGNVIADTHGCLLVGRTRTDGGIGESRIAFEHLFAQLVGVDEPITLTIENPRTPAPVDVLQV